MLINDNMQGSASSLEYDKYCHGTRPPFTEIAIKRIYRYWYHHDTITIWRERYTYASRACQLDISKIIALYRVEASWWELDPIG